MGLLAPVEDSRTAGVHPVVPALEEPRAHSQLMRLVRNSYTPRRMKMHCEDVLVLSKNLKSEK